MLLLRPLARALAWHTLEFELVADEAEAQIARHPLLQPLDLLVAELDHLAAFDIDQMVVVAARCLLVAAAPSPEVVPLQETIGRKELDGAIDGRKRDAGIYAARPSVDLFDVGMIPGGGEDLGDDPALPRQPQPLLRAQYLYACGRGIWRDGHGSPI